MDTLPELWCSVAAPCTWTLRTLVESLVDTGELVFAFYLDYQVDGKLATGGVDNVRHQGTNFEISDAAVETEFVITVPSATIGTLRLMNSQAPEAKTILGKYPVSRDTVHSGCQAKPQTHSTSKSDPGC